MNPNDQRGNYQYPNQQQQQQPQQQQQQRQQQQQQMPPPQMHPLRQGGYCIGPHCNGGSLGGNAPTHAPAPSHGGMQQYGPPPMPLLSRPPPQADQRFQPHMHNNNHNHPGGLCPGGICPGGVYPSGARSNDNCPGGVCPYTPKHNRPPQ